MALGESARQHEQRHPAQPKNAQGRAANEEGFHHSAAVRRHDEDVDVLRLCGLGYGLRHHGAGLAAVGHRVELLGLDELL